MIQHKEGSLMTKHRNFSIFLGRTPQGAMMGVLCAILIALLAACGGGSTSTTPGSTGGTLSGGTDIASNVIGVALSIPDAGLNKVICAARAKGIAVVAFNIDGATGQGASCVQGFVGQDFVQSGALIAQKMIDSGQIKPGDHVFCPVEFPAQVYAVQRYQGVKQALSAIGATCEELGTGVDFGPAKSTMVSYLLGHPHTSAIIALGHAPLDQAPAAAKQVGRTIPIGGFDVTSDILSSIKSGAITATVDQQPYIQGFQSVMQLALYLKYAISPANINTSNGALIDKNNVDKVVSLVPDFR